MKLSRVQYLTVADILAVHQAVLLEGEDAGVLKPHELDGAVMAVQATFVGAPLLGSLAEVAAAYVLYLNRSQVFLDGNKRTSLFAALAFLEANGFVLDVAATDWLSLIVRLVRHEASRAELIEAFALAMGTAEELEW